MDWNEREAQLVKLAFIDESVSSYEVDQCGIYWDPTTKDFVVMTATGCSCWEGDIDEETHYSSLKEIEKSLINGDHRYHPSLKGAEQLMIEAKTEWSKL